jgi:hypothetical protein
MRLKQEKGAIKLRSSTYTLICAKDRPYIYLAAAKAKKPFAELFVLSSVHSLTGLDDTTGIGSWQIEEGAECIILSLSAKSSLWKAKTYRFICTETKIRYEVTIEGTGQMLSEVLYFGGYYSGQVRWGSGFFWSGQAFKKGFNPEPTTNEDYYFAPASGSMIDLSGVPLPGKAGWFFTPPPFCYAFQIAKSWLSMGIEAAVGQSRFMDYRYHGQQGSFYLSLNYEGYTEVNGSYTLPALGIDFAVNEYEALEKHVGALRSQKLVPNIQTAKPRWWHEPIFCGWGSQCFIASLEYGHAPNYAKQTVYEGFIETLEANDIVPGIVVLDDKWQSSYGENCVDEAKWPDIRGFISDQHKAGRKVLLWLKAWDPEGIPSEECIRNAAGLPLAIDPTNPVFEQRFRESICRMLADYGADGFKIDFTARIPCGPSAKSYGNIWGLELMKRYLFLIYDEAKKIKPDALIMSHTPHPYLADVLDMIRLNDINTGKDISKAMTHRARIASIACPDAIIDTDNWPITNRASWREYIRLQPELGIPSLYYASHIDSTGEALEAEDYALIREAWSKYRERSYA